jgi:hypothetical protein
MDFDLQSFIEKISKDDLSLLGTLIMDNKREKSLQLSCKLINQHFSHIPISACKHYGKYVYEMLQESVDEYFKNQRGGGQQYSYIINDFYILDADAELVNDRYEIVDDEVVMTISLNAGYDIITDNDGIITLHQHCIFVNDILDDNNTPKSLLFRLEDGTEKEFTFGDFSILNPDSKSVIESLESDDSNEEEKNIDEDAQYTYVINDFYILDADAELANDRYEIIDNEVAMNLTFNYTYDVISDRENENGEIILYHNAIFSGDIRDDNNNISALVFNINGNNKEFSIGDFSVLNPDSKFELDSDDEEEDDDADDEIEDSKTYDLSLQPDVDDY